jgi:uncharacterized protein (TIGR02300 family)
MASPAPPRLSPGAVMAKEIWGQKHICMECQAPFYDMRRDPIACPKCGKRHKPLVLLKSDGRSSPRRKRLPETMALAAAAEPQNGPVEANDTEGEELDDAARENDDGNADDEEEETEPIGDERDDRAPEA